MNLENVKNWETLILNVLSSLRKEEIDEKMADDSFFEEAFNNLGPLANLPDLNDEERSRVEFHIRSSISTSFSLEGNILANTDVERWLDDKRGEIEWNFWNAYKQYLLKQGRPLALINENSEIIDNILDLSGDPHTEGRWARKGLVMGNVQSGKTQNFIGLLNKAVDVGYKIIIVLGGHQNELRNQTQARIDEGFIGKLSRNLIEAGIATGAEPVGVGLEPSRQMDAEVVAFTTTEQDFNTRLANGLNYPLRNTEMPVVFCVKKIKPILESLKRWIVENNNLAEDGTLEAPLLFIDDESDYASINAKKHKEEISAINAEIRSILSKFSKSTYVGYSATPFGNVFIDPDEDDDILAEDLFPKDFMIRIPVPEEYCGQEFFYANQNDGGDFEDESNVSSPVIVINDNEDMLPISKQKKDMEIGSLPKSLEDAICCFILNGAIKKIREDVSEKHDTMLVNVTHFNALQIKVQEKISDFMDVGKDRFESYWGLGPKGSLKDPFIKEVKNNFEKYYSIKESWEDVFEELKWSVNKIKILRVNSTARDQESLDYSVYPKGLSVIAIGGHKLSRGLTLEGLSISYFARNSRSYDTLMQMCRWFGYRPGYKDICKVFMPKQSLEWYRFISGAILELYAELDKMVRLNRTPKDFGLKVRNHPGSLIITAKNKIGYAANTVKSYEIWGQRIKRFSFYDDEKKNKENLKYCNNFLKNLTQEGIETEQWEKNENDSSKIYHDVPHEKIIDFIENIKINDDQLIENTHVINSIRALCEGENSPKFKICLFTAETQSETWWSKKIQDQEGFVESYTLDGVVVKPGLRKAGSNRALIESSMSDLGDPNAERKFIHPDLRQKVEDECKKKRATSADYIRSDDRDFPGLSIYLFNLGILSPQDAMQNASEGDPQHLRSVRYAFPGQPTLGYAISFPILENMRDMNDAEIREMNREASTQYLVTRIHEKLQMDLFEEQEDDFDVEHGGDA